MKKTTRLLGIFALTALIGFSFTSCGSDDGDDTPAPGGVQRPSLL